MVLLAKRKWGCVSPPLFLLYNDSGGCLWAFLWGGKLWEKAVYVSVWRDHTLTRPLVSLEKR